MFTFFCTCIKWLARNSPRNSLTALTHLQDGRKLLFIFFIIRIQLMSWIFYCNLNQPRNDIDDIRMLQTKKKCCNNWGTANCISWKDHVRKCRRIRWTKWLKYQRPDAVIPSKNARCPPCFTVAKTIFLFALSK